MGDGVRTGKAEEKEHRCTRATARQYEQRSSIRRNDGGLIAVENVGGRLVQWRVIQLVGAGRNLDDSYFGSGWRIELPSRRASCHRCSEHGPPCPSDGARQT